MSIVGHLLHGFDELLLDVRGDVRTVPLISLRCEFERDHPNVAADVLDNGGGFDLKRHLEGYIER